MVKNKHFIKIIGKIFGDIIYYSYLCNVKIIEAAEERGRTNQGGVFYA